MRVFFGMCMPFCRVGVLLLGLYPIFLVREEVGEDGDGNFVFTG